MKNKNQAGQNMLESAAKAANEDGFSAVVSRDLPTNNARQPAWSPYEVWRTRVKAVVPGQPSVRRP